MKKNFKGNEISQKTENKNFSELKTFKTQAMSVSDNVSVRQYQELKQCQRQTVSAPDNIMIWLMSESDHVTT